MIDCETGQQPKTPSQKHCPESEEEKLDTPVYAYASAGGSLMHLMICMRADIAFAVSMISRSQETREEHTGWLFNGFLDT